MTVLDGYISVLKLGVIKVLEIYFFRLCISLKDSLKTLEEAHRLVNVNLHNSAQYKKELEVSEEVNRATVEKLERTEGEVTEVRGQLEKASVERKKVEEVWKNTVSGKRRLSCFL